MVQSESSSGSGQRLCSNCGEPIAVEARFCPHCGAAAGAQPRAGSPAEVLVPRTDHIKYRNMVLQVILAILTFGIYTIYWYYVTLDELHKANGKTEGAGLWTILLFVPILSLFSNWHHSNEYADFVDDKYPGIGIFILWLVFSPAVWFLVQSDLNRVANRES